MCFLCDHMLGTLVTWLRCLGYDTIYASDSLSDKEILQQAADEKRTLITRDKMLIKQAKKNHISVIAIESDDLKEQIAGVICQKEFDESKVFSRCLGCNTLLQQKDKKDAKQFVPPRIYEFHDRFWYCPCCDQYFWHGTHYKDMKQKIQSLVSSFKH
ncbi:MAG: Mut7-C RNAse domain-containing protein [Thermoplasmatota archaeon]